MAGVKNKKTHAWYELVSFCASFFISLYFFYLEITAGRFFWVLSIITLLEGLITLFCAFVKNKMVVGVFETVHSILLSLIIMLFALFDKSKYVNYPVLITLLIFIIAIKSAIAIYCKKKYDIDNGVIDHLRASHHFVSALTYLQMLIFVIVSLILLQNKIIARGIIDIVVNFIITNVIVTVATFILVRLHTEEKLTFIGKIKFIVHTLIKKDVFMFVGFFFSFMVVLFTFFNGIFGAVELRQGYVSLSAFYFTIFLTRIVSHLALKKADKRALTQTDKKRTRAKTSLFVSIALLIEGETISTALMFFMQNKAFDQTPFWWFFLFLLPFALWRGVSCVMYLIRAKKEGDLKLKSLGTIDLVSSGFSICGVLAMAYRYLNYRQNILKAIFYFVIALQVIETILIIKLLIESIKTLVKSKAEEKKQKTE